MPCNNLRFLVVEDHEFQLKMQVRLLASLGAQIVHTAANGKAALELLHDPTRPVDVVICDLAMPTMDGVEFARNLDKLRPDISLIVNSGLNPVLFKEIAKLMETYSVKLLGCVEKPLTAEKLGPLLELHRSLAQGTS